MPVIKRFVASSSIAYWTLAFFLSGLDDEYYHIKLGDAYLELGLYWGAVKHFKAALKEKERAWSHMQIGWALYQLNQFEDALVHTRRAYELWPNPALAASLAKTEWSYGNYAESRGMAQVARTHQSQLDEKSLAILYEVEAELTKL